MEEIKAGTKDQNDQIMAALAHLSVVLPMMGIIGAIVIWVTQKEKSEFVAFQALQAIAYHLVLILGWFVGMALYMCSFLGSFLVIPLAAGSEEMLPFSLVGMFIPFLVLPVIMAVGLVFMIYGVVAAVKVFQGKDFRYAIIGRRLERYLNKSENTAAPG